MNMHSSNAATAEEAIAAQEALPPLTNEEATKVAMSNTLLTPRFYTTDFDEMDAIDVTPVRKDWDVLIGADESGPEQGSLQEKRRLGHRRLGRDGASAEGGIHRLSDLKLYG